MKKFIISVFLVISIVTSLGFCDVFAATKFPGLVSSAYSVPMKNTPVMTLFNAYAGHIYDIVIYSNSSVDTYLYSIDNAGNANFEYHSKTGIQLESYVSTSYLTITFPSWVGSYVTVLVYRAN